MSDILPQYQSKTFLQFFSLSQAAKHTLTLTLTHMYIHTRTCTHAHTRTRTGTSLLTRTHTHSFFLQFILQKKDKHKRHRYYHTTPGPCVIKVCGSKIQHSFDWARQYGLNRFVNNKTLSRLINIYTLPILEVGVFPCGARGPVMNPSSS